ncbi:MAG TPA: hypothetical protein QGG47_04965 [Acidobacteriota bacterium]|nr:hypothetical protein [Acidobacteriota bacterium]
MSRPSIVRVVFVALLVAVSVAPRMPAPAGAQEGSAADARLRLALARRRLLSGDEQTAQREDRRIGSRRDVGAAGFRRLSPEPGELLSVTEKRFRVLEFNVEDPAGIQAKKVKTSFVARGVDFDSSTSLLAIAAVSRVLFLDVSKTRNNLTELVRPGEEADSFGFANDVVFDGRGGLVIADQGGVAGGRTVADGRVWRYDLQSGEFSRLAPRKELFNPKLLALDLFGNVYFVDGEAGPLITPLFTDRWDSLWRITGKKLTKPRVVWSRAGIQATAFDIDRAGRYWFANLAELVIIAEGQLRLPCPLPFPFEFVTGLAAGRNGTAFVLDGADVKGPERWLYGIDTACTAVKILSGKKLRGSRGLAAVEEPRG